MKTWKTLSDMNVLSLSGVLMKDCISIHYKNSFGYTIINPYSKNPLANHIPEKIRLLKPFCHDISE